MAESAPRLNTSPHPPSGDPLHPPHKPTTVPDGHPTNMNSREHSEMPPAPSYPSPNAAQMGQGTMQYYSNRQLTADELLSAELSRETSGANLADGSSNGLHHGQSMVLGSNPGASEMARTTSPEQQHNHMLQFTPNQQVGVDPNHDLSYGDQSARRKRSKVSRACDECRRKKVRCDATSEAGVETCSNCRRLGVACQFSRVPMKRGPSKGYIKELAERLNTLESQMQPSMAHAAHAEMQYQTMNDVSSPRGYHDFSPPMDGSLLSRKRTFSMSEGFPSSTFAQQPFHHRAQPIGDSNILPDFLTGTMSNGTASKTLPFWASGDNEHGLQAPADVSDVSKPAAEDTTPVEVDEGALNAYYRSIHPILPILPNSKDRVLGLLHQCSRELQEVFLHALYAVTRANLSRLEKTFEKVLSFENAQELVFSQARENHQLRSTAINLIWLETILLMTLESDSRGPENLRGRNGIPKSILAEMAGRLGWSVAKSLGQLRSGPKRLEDAEIDSDAAIARRDWTVATILCRWHAVSVAEPDPFVTNEIAAAGDEKLLSPATLQLAQYSTILPPVLEMQAMEESMPSSYSQTRTVKSVIYNEMERIAATEPDRTSTSENPFDGFYFEVLGPQVFWTIKLLTRRLLFMYNPYEVVHCAEVLVQEMYKTTNNPRIASPFDLHSLALATMTLLESTDLPMFTSMCWEALGKVEQILDRRQKQASEAGEFENIFATPGWDARLRRIMEWKRSEAQAGQTQNVNVNNAANAPGVAAPPVMGPNEQRSLQHLADLAVGAEGAVAANASSPPATTTTTAPSGDANATTTTATATTSAAPAPGQTTTAPPNPTPQQQQPQQHVPVYIDYTILSKKGYLNVIGGWAR